MSDKYCILQDDIKDCGVSCLLSIIKYYGGYVSKECLREMTKTDKNGVNALNILRCARELGFEGYGLKTKIKSIKQELLPIICHVVIDKKLNHFVVLYKIDFKKSRVLIMDPSKGYVFLKFSEFQNISTGYFIVLKPKQIIPKIEENNQVIYIMKTVFIKYKNILISIIFMSIIFVLINVITSYNFKILINNLISNDLHIVFIFLIALGVFKYIIFLFRTNLINYVNIILDKEIVKKTFNHIINLPYLYYRNHTYGDLLTRINDLGNIRELVSNLIIIIFVDFFLGLVILFVLSNINIKLSIIASIFLIIYVIISYLFNRFIRKNIEEGFRVSSTINNYIVESFSSFETIKNLSIQNYICNIFNKKYDDYSNINNRLLKIINSENFLKNTILSLMNLIIVYYGVLLIRDNVLSIASLITYISLLDYLVMPIKNILDLQIIYESSKESLRRIKEILNIPTEKNGISKNTSIKKLIGSIEVNDLSYSYNGISNVINNVSLNINAQEKVLIYGDSGSGKSTLMQLIVGYLDKNFVGNITLGGLDLKKLDLFTLRENICYVSQNEYLYTDSIYENITLGRKIAYKDFIKICENLYIDKIVNNSSLGYNYLIESNGDNISGGEKERIIIARSLLSKASIYIFDESFSSLDINMERNILQYIFDIYNDKTIIVISHRKSNIDLYNQKIKVGSGTYVREEN